MKRQRRSREPDIPARQPPAERRQESGDNPAEYDWRAEHREQIRKANEERFERACPPLYRDTDRARLPSRELQAVESWKFGPKGLLLAGPTGSGKTRCAWLLLRRLIAEEGRKVRVFDGIGWGLAVSRAFGEPERTERWLREIRDAEVLFIDDLFKAKMTEAQEQALHDVFEKRAAWRRPIIATMNSTGETILGRMTEEGRAERGDALIRRMREFCEIVAFDVP